METNLDEIEINILNKCTLENTHEFCFTGDALCKVLRVIDGDTFVGAIVFNNLPYICTFRMYGINAPELHPRKDVENREDVKSKGLAAKGRLRDAIEGKICNISMKDRDAFGRILTVVHSNSLDICELMIKEGFAVQFKKN